MLASWALPSVLSEVGDEEFLNKAGGRGGTSTAAGGASVSEQGDDNSVGGSKSGRRRGRGGTGGAVVGTSSNIALQHQGGTTAEVVMNSKNAGKGNKIDEKENAISSKKGQNQHDYVEHQPHSAKLTTTNRSGRSNTSKQAKKTTSGAVHHHRRPRSRSTSRSSLELTSDEDEDSEKNKSSPGLRSLQLQSPPDNEDDSNAKASSKRGQNRTRSSSKVFDDGTSDEDYTSDSAVVGAHSSSSAQLQQVGKNNKQTGELQGEFLNNDIKTGRDEPHLPHAGQTLKLAAVQAIGTTNSVQGRGRDSTQLSRNNANSNNSGKNNPKGQMAAALNRNNLQNHALRAKAVENNQQGEQREQAAVENNQQIEQREQPLALRTKAAVENNQQIEQREQPLVAGLKRRYFRVRRPEADFVTLYDALVAEMHQLQGRSSSKVLNQTSNPTGGATSTTSKHDFVSGAGQSMNTTRDQFFPATVAERVESFDLDPAFFFGKPGTKENKLEKKILSPTSNAIPIMSPKSGNRSSSSSSSKFTADEEDEDDDDDDLQIEKIEKMNEKDKLLENPIMQVPPGPGEREVDLLDATPFDVVENQSQSGQNINMKQSTSSEMKNNNTSTLKRLKSMEDQEFSSFDDEEYSYNYNAPVEAANAHIVVEDEDEEEKLHGLPPLLPFYDVDDIGQEVALPFEEEDRERLSDDGHLSFLDSEHGSRSLHAGGGGHSQLARQAHGSTSQQQQNRTSTLKLNTANLTQYNELEAKQRVSERITPDERVRSLLQKQTVKKEAESSVGVTPFMGLASEAARSGVSGGQNAGSGLESYKNNALSGHHHDHRSSKRLKTAAGAAQQLNYGSGVPGNGPDGTTNGRTTGSVRGTNAGATGTTNVLHGASQQLVPVRAMASTVTSKSGHGRAAAVQSSKETDSIYIMHAVSSLASSSDNNDLEEVKKRHAEQKALQQSGNETLREAIGHREWLVEPMLQCLTWRVWNGNDGAHQIQMLITGLPLVKALLSVAWLLDFHNLQGKLLTAMQPPALVEQASTGEAGAVAAGQNTSLVDEKMNGVQSPSAVDLPKRPSASDVKAILASEVQPLSAEQEAKIVLLGTATTASRTSAGVLSKAPNKKSPVPLKHQASFDLDALMTEENKKELQQGKGKDTTSSPAGKMQQTAEAFIRFVESDLNLAGLLVKEFVSGSSLLVRDSEEIPPWFPDRSTREAVYVVATIRFYESMLLAQEQEVLNLPQKLQRRGPDSITEGTKKDTEIPTATTKNITQLFVESAVIATARQLMVAGHDDFHQKGGAAASLATTGVLNPSSSEKNPVLSLLPHDAGLPARRLALEWLSNSLVCDWQTCWLRNFPLLFQVVDSLVSCTDSNRSTLAPEHQLGLAEIAVSLIAQFLELLKVDYELCYEQELIRFFLMKRGAAKIPGKLLRVKYRAKASKKTTRNGGSKKNSGRVGTRGRATSASIVKAGTTTSKHDVLSSRSARSSKHEFSSSSEDSESDSDFTSSDGISTSSSSARRTSSEHSDLSSDSDSQRARKKEWYAKREFASAKAVFSSSSGAEDELQQGDLNLRHRQSDRRSVGGRSARGSSAAASADEGPQTARSSKRGGGATGNNNSVALQQEQQHHLASRGIWYPDISDHVLQHMLFSGRAGVVQPSIDSPPLTPALEQVGGGAAVGPVQAQLLGGATSNTSAVGDLKEKNPSKPLDSTASLQHVQRVHVLRSPRPQQRHFLLENHNELVERVALQQELRELLAKQMESQEKQNPDAKSPNSTGSNSMLFATIGTARLHEAEVARFNKARRRAFRKVLRSAESRYDAGTAELKAAFKAQWRTLYDRYRLPMWRAAGRFLLHLCLVCDRATGAVLHYLGKLGAATAARSTGAAHQHRMLLSKEEMLQHSSGSTSKAVLSKAANDTGTSHDLKAADRGPSAAQFASNSGLSPHRLGEILPPEAQFLSDFRAGFVRFVDLGSSSSFSLPANSSTIDEDINILDAPESMEDYFSKHVWQKFLQEAKPGLDREEAFREKFGQPPASSAVGVLAHQHPGIPISGAGGRGAASPRGAAVQHLLPTGNSSSSAHQNTKPGTSSAQSHHQQNNFKNLHEAAGAPLRDANGNVIDARIHHMISPTPNELEQEVESAVRPLFDISVGDQHQQNAALIRREPFTFQNNTLDAQHHGNKNYTQQHQPKRSLAAGSKAWGNRLGSEIDRANLALEHESQRRSVETHLRATAGRGGAGEAQQPLHQQLSLQVGRITLPGKNNTAMNNQTERGGMKPGAAAHDVPPGPAKQASSAVARSKPILRIRGAPEVPDNNYPAKNMPPLDPGKIILPGGGAAARAAKASAAQRKRSETSGLLGSHLQQGAAGTAGAAASMQKVAAGDHVQPPQLVSASAGTSKLHSGMKKPPPTSGGNANKASKAAGAAGRGTTGKAKASKAKGAAKRKPRTAADDFIVEDDASSSDSEELRRKRRKTTRDLLG
ncbi:unnamed protein product [Amoebophrya sp. A120]|nr:unnamed protein product [Amoebophrya sp. A120]|eukprot:GSA120T00023409001.1